MKSHFFTLIVLAIVILIAGCSSITDSNPTEGPLNQTTENSLSPIPIIGQSIDTATGLLGAYTLALSNDGLSADLVPVRSSALGESFIVSGMGFFTMTPCTDCLKIKNISLNTSGNVVLGFVIKHPFPMGNEIKPPNARNRKDLDIFDVALLVKPADVTSVFYSKIKAGVYTGILANADGYTTELGSLLQDDSAIPFKICYEDANNNRFVMGIDYQPFQVEFIPGSGLVFDLYLTMGYGAAAKKSTFMYPVYYIPEFNRKQAWKVMVTPPEGQDPPLLGNTWDSTDIATEYPVTIDIYDWNQGAIIAGTYPDPDNTDHISAASDISSVAVEIPGMTSTAILATTEDIFTNGWDDPITYTANIANANALPAGIYTGLVKVTDSRVPADSSAPYTPGTLVHTPDGILLDWYQIPEFATYQTFTATVVEAVPCDSPVPTSIVPSTFYTTPGIYDDITIYGNYFTGSGGVTDVYLDNLTDQFHASDINVVSDTELTCDFDVSTAPLGSYDVVVVTACEGRASLVTIEEMASDYPEWRCFQYNEANIGTHLVNQNFDPSSYTLKWYKSRTGLKYAGPVVTENYVYATENNTFYANTSMKIVCYDINNLGNIVWEQPINPSGYSAYRAFSSPCWVDDGEDGRLVVGGEKVWCFDALTGDVEWEYGDAYHFYGASPKYYDGKIFISSNNGYIHCINPDNGSWIWSSLPGTSGGEATPTIIDGLIYVGYGHKITCLYADTGVTKWQSADYGACTHWDSPCVVGDRLYYASIEHVFTCLSTVDGSFIWNYSGAGQWISSTTAWIDPSDDTPVLFFTSAWSSDPGIFALKDFGSHGEIFWQSPNFYSDSSPVIINDVVYAGNTSGDWYGYTVDTGTQVFHETLSGAARSAAGFAFDRMVVPTENGLYVFE